MLRLQVVHIPKRILLPFQNIIAVDFADVGVRAGVFERKRKWRDEVCEIQNIDEKKDAGNCADSDLAGLFELFTRKFVQDKKDERNEDQTCKSG